MTITTAYTVAYFNVDWISLTVFSCDLAALRTILSVCPSVWLSARPSVRRPSHLLTILPLTDVMSMQMFKVRFQRSRSQRSRPNLAISGLLTPIWIHLWLWNDAWSLMLLSRDALLFSMYSVKFQCHMANKTVDFDPNWAFTDCNSNLNSVMAMKWCAQLEVA